MGYENGFHNSVYGLTNSSFVNSQLFNETMKNASGINNSPKMPVFLFSLKNDSIVTILNTENYFNRYNETRKVTKYIFDNQNHKVCSLNKFLPLNVDHNGAQLLANIYALAFVQNRNI